VKSLRRDPCRRWDGRRKRLYSSMEDAFCWRFSPDLLPYECSECGWWHLGHAPYERVREGRDIKVRFENELGERAAAHLAQEHANVSKAIHSRFSAAHRKARINTSEAE
jgi:hypothetical protein